MKKYLSETKGIYMGGKAWQIEADKSCSDRKTLQDYMTQIKQ